MTVKSGIYLDMTAADYFADPAPLPSITQSLAKIILERSPLHAWHAHPRMNPDFKPDDDRSFDIGNVAHKLLLGRGKYIAWLDFDDWRTNTAKAARANAAKHGQLGVLGKHYALADRMVRAAREQLIMREERCFDAIGDGEAVLVWQEGPVWLRQMVDWLSKDRTIFADYKTTDMCAAPQNLGRMMASAGWPIQAAMAARGLDVLHPESAGRRRYLFIVQETQPPYCLNVVEIGGEAMTMGRKMLDAAIRIWRRCVDTDRWPSYPLQVQRPEYPGFIESAWLDREQIEFSDVLLAG